MKQIINIITVSAVALSFSFGIYLPKVSAQNGCAGANGVMQLSGYILASNIPGKIYVNNISYEDETGENTSAEFQITLNKNFGIWEGLAWGDNYDGGLGYIDFSYDQIDKKAIVSEVENDDSWGNWNGIIDLSGVSYNNQTGQFSGYGISQGYTGTGNNTENDVMVGIGILDFSNVRANQDSMCNELISLFFVDGKQTTTRKHYGTCSEQTIKLAWSSENVHNCQPGVGSWINPNSNRNNNNKSGEISAPFFKSDDDETLLFSLECIGDDTNKKVVGYAAVSCGQAELPESIDELIKPIFKEV